MLMVIFGAGASYDSCPTYPPRTRVPGMGQAGELNNYYRPPLANELFANRPYFRHAIDNFPECRPIVPRLMNLGKRSIEEVLGEIQGEAETYSPAKQELAAVQCYLHQVISETEREWHAVTRQITNYLALLREIERTHKGDEPVCLVTFNYDTLLENALFHFGLRFEGMFDYTRHRVYKVFKLHGSVNWARHVEPHIVAPNTHLTALQKMVQRASELQITDNYIFSSDCRMGVVQGNLAFPAIAIPVERKSTFECPQHMLDELTALLPQVTKVIVIGWRATEAHFLELLHQHLQWGRGLYFCIVLGNLQEAEGVKDRINRAFPGTQLSISPETTGFTEFVLTRRAEQVLGVLPSAP